MLGGALNPDYMYVLGHRPTMQGDPGQMMSLESHGWGEGADHKPGTYAELVAEEAGGFLTTAANAVCEPGTWDVVQNCVLCFYGDDGPPAPRPCALCGEAVKTEPAEMYDPGSDAGGYCHAQCGLDAGWEVA